MICDKRTENHNFTITTNMSQHVEFFHSLIFYEIVFLPHFATQKTRHFQEYLIRSKHVHLIDISHVYHDIFNFATLFLQLKIAT